MRKPVRNYQCCAAALAAMMFVGSAYADGQKVELKDVPAAVKATIDSNTPSGATIQEIELEEEGGQKLYSVEFKAGDKESEVEISTDGKLLKKEDAESEDKEDDDKDEADEKTITAEELPAAAKSAIENLSKSATLDKVTKETEDGATAYEAEYKENGAKASVKVSEDGQVLEVEKHASETPAAVKAAIDKKYPGGTVKSTEAVEVHFYEVKVEANGKTHEVKLNAAGSIMETEEGDED